MALNKEQLLQTAKDSKEVEIEGIEGKVKIRPLRDHENGEIQSLVMDSFNFSGNLGQDKISKLKDAKDKKQQQKVLNDLGIDVDLKKLNKLDQKSNYLACKYGLSVDEEWTLEEVGQLPTGAPKKIADAVFEYTGVDEKTMADVESFRGE